MNMSEIFRWFYIVLVFSGAYYLLSKFIDWIVYLVWIKPRLKKKEQEQSQMDQNRIMKQSVFNNQMWMHIVCDPEFYNHLENIEKELNINGIITEE